MSSSEDRSTHGESRQEPRLDIARGAGYAAAFGTIGFIAISILLSVLGYWVPKQIVLPAIGIAFILAGTGWATFAPRGNYRFAWTLATIFLITVPSWYALAPFMPESREKVAAQPLLYPSELLFLGVPPFTTVLILSMIRWKRQQEIVIE